MYVCLIHSTHRMKRIIWDGEESGLFSPVNNSHQSREKISPPVPPPRLLLAARFWRAPPLTLTPPTQWIRFAHWFNTVWPVTPHKLPLFTDSSFLSHSTSLGSLCSTPTEGEINVNSWVRTNVRTLLKQNNSVLETVSVLLISLAVLKGLYDQHPLCYDQHPQLHSTTVFLWLSGRALQLAAQKVVGSIPREHTYW